MFRPRRMNETISWVVGGVAPVAVAFFSTVGPRPCATATSPAGADDGAAANDDARNDGAARAATSTPATASAAAMTMAAIRRRRQIASRNGPPIVPIPVNIPGPIWSAEYRPLATLNSGKEKKQSPP